MDLPFTVDLVSQRIVYPNDLGIGLRQLAVTKGNTYNVTLSFVSGQTGVSVSPSGIVFSVCTPNALATPLISLSGMSGTGFGLYLGSPVLDYAINQQDSLLAQTNLSFLYNGTGYNLLAVSTVITNTPSLTPQNQYYPLSGNPAGYITSGNLPSTSNIQSFTYTIPTGADRIYVPFPQGFTGVPTVSCTLDIPSTGYLYNVATSGTTPSGFGVYLSSTVNTTGYKLSVIAKE